MGSSPILSTVVYSNQEKEKIMKQFVICREKTCGIYSIRVNTDCSKVRFEIIKDFDTYEEADTYLHKYFFYLK